MKSTSSVGFLETFLVGALEYVRNPWFPATSIALGNLSEWFVKFATWLGIRLGVLKRPLWRLMRRRDRVRWSQLPTWLRLGGAVIAGAVSLLAIGCLSKLGKGKKS